MQVNNSDIFFFFFFFCFSMPKIYLKLAKSAIVELNWSSVMADLEPGREHSIQQEILKQRHKLARLACGKMAKSEQQATKVLLSQPVLSDKERNICAPGSILKKFTTVHHKTGYHSELL